MSIYVQTLGKKNETKRKTTRILSQSCCNSQHTNMSCRDRNACNMVWTSLVLITLLQAVWTGRERNQDSGSGNYVLLLQNDNADILYVITKQAALTVRACRFYPSCDEVTFVMVRVRTVKQSILRPSACHRHPGFSQSYCLGVTRHFIARQNAIKAL